MIRYVVYNSTTGRIHRHGVCQPGMLSEVGHKVDQTVMEVYSEVDPKVEMVDISSGDIISKPAYPVAINKTTVTADEVDEITITGLPAGCTVTVTGPVFSEAVINDGTAEINFYLPGEYMVRAWNELGELFLADITAVEAT